MTSAFALLGAGAGYALGGVPGALIGSSIGGGLDANQARADAAASAQQFSAEQYATRYQTQVKDMEAAGLNPMLAYMQSPGASPQGVSYQPTNAFESAARDYSSSYNVERTGENIDTDTELKGSTIRLNEAQADQVAESTRKISAEIRNLDTDNERLKALIDNLREEKQVIMKTGWNLTEQGNVLRATVDKLRTEVPWLNSQSFLNFAKEALTKVETDLRNLDLNSAQKFDNFGRDYKQVSPAIRDAADVLKHLFRKPSLVINK